MPKLRGPTERMPVGRCSFITTRPPMLAPDSRHGCKLATAAEGAFVRALGGFLACLLAGWLRGEGMMDTACLPAFVVARRIDQYCVVRGQPLAGWAPFHKVPTST